MRFNMSINDDTNIRFTYKEPNIDTEYRFFLSPIPFITESKQFTNPQENIRDGRDFESAFADVYQGQTFSNHIITLSSYLLFGQDPSGYLYSPSATETYGSSKFFGTYQRELKKMFSKVTKIEIGKHTAAGNPNDSKQAFDAQSTFSTAKLLSLNFTDENLMSYCRYSAEFLVRSTDWKVSNYQTTHELTEDPGFRSFYFGTDPQDSSRTKWILNYNYSAAGSASENSPDINLLPYTYDTRVYKFSFSESATGKNGVLDAQSFVEDQDLFRYLTSEKTGGSLNKCRYYIPLNFKLINTELSYSADHKNGTYTRNLIADCVPKSSTIVAKVDHTLEYGDSADPTLTINAEVRGPESAVTIRKYRFFESIASGVLENKKVIMISNSCSKLLKRDFSIENYNVKFQNDRRIPYPTISSGILDYDIEINYQHPGDVFSIVPIIGRPSSLLQVGAGQTSRKTSIDITLYLQSGVQKYLQSDIDEILSVHALPYPSSGVKRSAPTIDVNETDGIVRYSVDYTHI